MPVVKNKSTPENRAFWEHVEGIATQVRERRGADMSQELKPCPFCGKQAKTQTNRAGGLVIFCNSLECELLSIDGEAEDEHENAALIAAWNTRSDAHLLRSHEALVLALTNCRNGLELLLQSHKPEHPDDPFDTINELRETVKNSTAALTEAAAPPEQSNAEYALQRITEWCDAYPLDFAGGIFNEPDMEEVQRRLGPELLTQLSAHSFRHVLKGIKRIIDEAAALEPQKGLRNTIEGILAESSSGNWSRETLATHIHQALEPQKEQP
jgi:hypothetical protein